MNYLSHFFLHRDEADLFFTNGLTLPDVMGFFRRSVRISEKFLLNIDSSRLEPAILSLMAGMIIHYRIDRWFHRSRFFHETTQMMQTQFTALTGARISHFHVHILLEILIDRFLLLENPSLAADFYYSWQNCKWQKTLGLFSHLDGFSAEAYLQTLTQFGYSRFLGQYHDLRLIRVFLDRLSEKVSFAGLEPLPDQQYTEFFSLAYQEHMPGFRQCLSEAGSLGLNKINVLAEISR